MTENEQTKCQRCGGEISFEESYVVNDLTLCDDCYLDRSHRVKISNSLTICSAKCFQSSDGLEATERLNDLQKAICKVIKSKVKITVQELYGRFKLSQAKIENQLAIWQHLDLIKAKNEQNKIYIVQF